MEDQILKTSNLLTKKIEEFKETEEDYKKMKQEFELKNSKHLQNLSIDKNTNFFNQKVFTTLKTMKTEDVQIDEENKNFD